MKLAAILDADDQTERFEVETDAAAAEQLLQLMKTRTAAGMKPDAGERGSPLKMHIFKKHFSYFQVLCIRKTAVFDGF